MVSEECMSLCGGSLHFPPFGGGESSVEGIGHGESQSTSLVIGRW